MDWSRLVDDGVCDRAGGRVSRDACATAAVDENGRRKERREVEGTRTALAPGSRIGILSLRSSVVGDGIGGTRVASLKLYLVPGEEFGLEILVVEALANQTRVGDPQWLTEVQARCADAVATR